LSTLKGGELSENNHRRVRKEIVTRTWQDVAPLRQRPRKKLIVRRIVLWQIARG